MNEFLFWISLEVQSLYSCPEHTVQREHRSTTQTDIVTVIIIIGIVFISKNKK